MDDSARKGVCSVVKRGKGMKTRAPGKELADLEQNEECCNCGEGGKAMQRSNAELTLQ